MTSRPCKACGAPLIFAKTTDGRTIPLDARNLPIYRLEGEGTSATASRCDPKTMVSHFVTCPKASDFSRGRRGS